MTMTYKEQMLEQKRQELAERETTLTTQTILERYETMKEEGHLANPSSLKKALETDAYGLVAEFKRKSPNVGVLNAEAVPQVLCPSFAGAGAAAVSMQTNEAFFDSKLAFLRTAYGTIEGNGFTIPVLRNDVIISERQLLEARLFGASAVQLDADFLSPEEYAQLLTYAHSIGLEVVVAIHNANQLSYAQTDADIVAVVNYDFATFTADVQTAISLIEQLPKDKVLLAEGGVRSAEDVRLLKAAGYHGVLLGNYLMSQPDPGAALLQLRREL